MENQPPQQTPPKSPPPKATPPKAVPPSGPSGAIGDAFGDFLDGVAKLLFWAGLALSLIAVGFLVFTFQSAIGGASIEQAKANADLFQKILIGGVISLFVGSTYMFWGEEVMAVLQILGSALLYFGPPFLPGMMGGGAMNAGSEAALGALQAGGGVFGICAIGSLIADLAVRARGRIRDGAKADLLKYGKGIKQERDVQNVFMGKCWQLPFCRKFVRERCPIYHSNRTCWKEQVGCMCEEEVIRGAMEGRIVPKDAVAAAKMIPVNQKFTREQKFERCKQCVIYNEHQKHKYKLALPVMVVVFVGCYIILRPWLSAGTSALLMGLDRMMGRITFGASGNVGQQITQNAIPIQEIVLVCLMLILFTYALKMLEYVIFKLKY